MIVCVVPTLPATIDRGPRPYQNVSPEEAEELLALGAVVLDVRTPREHEELGHIPGALLLPVELVSAAPAVLPDDGRPVVVVCEHGVRSRQAAALLAEAGIEACNMAGGMSRWTGPRVHEPSPVSGPSPWLLANAHLAPRGARTLDVACGRGRHALLLAGAGFPVRAVDRDPVQVQWLNALARRLQLPLDAAVVDLESGGADLGEEEWELVLVFNYLHRELFPSLVRALAPGGLLLCETYTREQANRGRPTNPDHLLEPGELPRLVAPLEVVRQREGEFDGRAIASVAARKPSSRPSRRGPASPASGRRAPGATKARSG
jgi:rhodanese-related sulfurtransferase